MEVRVLDDLSTGFQPNMDGLKCRFIEGSILDTEALVAPLEDVDSIVHLAAIPSVPRSLANPVLVAVSHRQYFEMWSIVRTYLREPAGVLFDVKGIFDRSVSDLKL